jgi:hypothetical protein
MNGTRALLWTTLALALAACGSRTSLRPTDAFVDDEPWLKVDASAPRDARTDARDGGVGYVPAPARDR